MLSLDKEKRKVLQILDRNTYLQQKKNYQHDKLF